MKAIQIKQYGGEEQLEMVEVPNRGQERDRWWCEL
jgi:hypothetical protein